MHGKGAVLSPYAHARLNQVIKMRGLTAFAATTGVTAVTLKKLAAGGYTYADIVQRVEAAFVVETRTEAIIELVAKRMKVDRFVITQPPSRGHQRYFSGELPACLRAKWVTCFLLYRETKASYRTIAAAVGYSHPDWVRDVVLKVFDLADTDPAFRRQVVRLQAEAATLGLR